MRKPRGPVTRPGYLPLGTGQAVGRASHALGTPGEPKRLEVTQNARQAQKMASDTSEARERVVDAIYAVVLAGMSEKRFQALIVSALRHRGFTCWTIPNMRQTTAGWPDLVFWHPSFPGRLWAWELKTVRGRATPKQQRTIDHLRTVSGIDARIVRPQDWSKLRDDIDAALSRVVQ